MSWRSEQCTRKTRVTDVVYHPANNEYVRTKTLTKSAIVTIDATPFKLWYRNYYNIDLSKGTSQMLKFDVCYLLHFVFVYNQINNKKITKKIKSNMNKEEREEFEQRRKNRVLPKKIEEQFKVGKLLACVSSKPGQVGRADGYILEGAELEFYQKKIAARRKK